MKSIAITLGILALCALEVRVGANVRVPAQQVPAEVHPLVGTWIGRGASVEGVTLTLAADGTGRLGDAALTWRSSAPRKLTYVLAGEEVHARYTLTGAQLVVRAAGESFVFERAPERPIVEGFQVPPPITGAFAGPIVRLGHSAGHYTFEAPAGWSVAREDEDGLWLNPGLDPRSTLDALVRVEHGELEVADRGVAPAALVRRHEAGYTAALRELGLTLEANSSPPRSVLVAGVPGAVQEWKGAQERGGQPVRIWLGGLVVREWYLTITAVVLEERAEQFVPGLLRALLTLAPRPPERNLTLEATLVGRGFRRSETFPGAGSTYSTYRFQADGVVQKELLMGGRIGLDYDVNGSTQEAGRYEVVGTLLYLRFPVGQQTAQVVFEGEHPVALRIGDGVYKAR